jgi:hypothetical protein
LEEFEAFVRWLAEGGSVHKPPAYTPEAALEVGDESLGE